MKQITIDCPDGLLVALGVTAELFEHEAKLALAAKLFELGRLSSGKAVRLAGMDRTPWLRNWIGLSRRACESQGRCHPARNGSRSYLSRSLLLHSSAPTWTW